MYPWIWQPCLGNPFDTDGLGTNQARRAVVAGLRIAHVDGITAGHVGQQFLRRAYAKMRALFALAGNIFAVAIAMRHEHGAGFLALLHHVDDG
jgi:hypothetical protein